MQYTHCPGWDPSYCVTHGWCNQRVMRTIFIFMLLTFDLDTGTAAGAGHCGDTAAACYLHTSHVTPHHTAVTTVCRVSEDWFLSQSRCYICYINDKCCNQHFTVHLPVLSQIHSVKTFVVHTCTCK